MDQFLQQLLNGVTLGSLYALIAVGYTVVYGIVQLINFAHGEVFMIGAFGSLATWTLFFKGQTGLWVLPFMIIGAVLASVAVALLLERVAYRPLRNAPDWRHSSPPSVSRCSSKRPCDCSIPARRAPCPSRRSTS